MQFKAKFFGLYKGIYSGMLKLAEVIIETQIGS